MQHAARLAAAIDILDEILAGAAAEKALSGWARRHRFAGSKDRAAIRDHVFDALRMKRSCAALGGAETGRGIVLGLCLRQGLDPNNVFTGNGYAPPALTEPEDSRCKTSVSDHLKTLPPAVRLDCPDWVLDRLSDQMGLDAEAVLVAQQHRAPVFLRVNTLRGNMANACASLAADDIAVQPVEGFNTALEVTRNERKIRHSRAFIEGLVEFQDISSQASVSRLEFPPDARILDYCAGGGGKALALAAHPAKPSEIFAHDISEARMRDLPARSARASARIAILSSDELKTHGPFDLVFVDAPCSGSGTWRRTPDAKWRLSEEALDAYCRKQAEIIDKALELVVQGGVLVYATCSLFREENESQIDAFLSRNDGWVVVSSTRAGIKSGGDGFFSASMRRIGE